jgi:hypothetical protein
MTISISHAAEFKLDFAVVNNFRMLDGEKQQARYFKDIDIALVCMRSSRTLSSKQRKKCADHNVKRTGVYSIALADPKGSNNYKSRWSEKMQKYHDGFINEKKRTVRLKLKRKNRRGKFRNVSRNYSCQWILTQNGLQIGEFDKCTVESVNIEGGKPYDLEVAVTYRGSDRGTHNRTIEVIDLLILGLGDSFLSGEATHKLPGNTRQIRAPAKM